MVQNSKLKFQFQCECHLFLVTWYLFTAVPEVWARVLLFFLLLLAGGVFFIVPQCNVPSHTMEFILQGQRAERTRCYIKKGEGERFTDPWVIATRSCLLYQLNSLTDYISWSQGKFSFKRINFFNLLVTIMVFMTRKTTWQKRVLKRIGFWF